MNFEFGPVVQMSFQYISYLELCRPFCSAERIHKCNFDRGYYEEQFCKIVLNLDQWFRRRCLLFMRYFFSGALVPLFVNGVEPFVKFW